VSAKSLGDTYVFNAAHVITSAGVASLGAESITKLVPS